MANFKVWAENSNNLADITTQASEQTDGVLRVEEGLIQGDSVKSDEINSVLRQNSLMTTALAEVFLKDIENIDFNTPLDEITQILNNRLGKQFITGLGKPENSNNNYIKNPPLGLIYINTENENKNFIEGYIYKFNSATNQNEWVKWLYPKIKNIIFDSATTWIPPQNTQNFDIRLFGGGAGGAGCGGGGGYYCSQTFSKDNINDIIIFNITIGEGGKRGEAGGTSSVVITNYSQKQLPATVFTANGGHETNESGKGNGGSGGGGGIYSLGDGLAGGEGALFGGGGGGGGSEDDFSNSGGKGGQGGPLGGGGGAGGSGFDSSVSGGFGQSYTNGGDSSPITEYLRNKYLELTNFSIGKVLGGTGGLGGGGEQDASNGYDSSIIAILSIDSPLFPSHIDLTQKRGLGGKAGISYPGTNQRFRIGGGGGGGAGYGGNGGNGGDGCIFHIARDYPDGVGGGGGGGGGYFSNGGNGSTGINYKQIGYGGGGGGYGGNGGDASAITGGGGGGGYGPMGHGGDSNNIAGYAAGGSGIEKIINGINTNTGGQGICIISYIEPYLNLQELFN